MPSAMIRSGRNSDVPAIRSFDEFQNFRQEEAEEGRMYVFEQSGSAVGYVSLTSYRFLGHPMVAFLCIAPEWRRCGIGSKLLAHVETLYQGQRITTSTEAWNEPMRRLLAKRGYSVSGSLSSLNQDGSDEVFYWKDALIHADKVKCETIDAVKVSKT